jgi:gas vesicle protein
VTLNKGNSFIVGVVVGGVIGSITMLLSTPKSGVELRTAVKENSRDLSEKLYHLKTEAKDFLSLLENSTKEGTEVVKEFAEDVQKTINVWKREIGPHQVNIQREMKEIEETLLQLEEAFAKNSHQLKE